MRNGDVEQINHFIDQYHIGPWTSIFGLIVSFFGFLVTIENVVRSRDAATRAEEAANRAIEAIKGIEVVDGLAESVTLLDEITRLNRAGEWTLVLDRHVALRKIIADLKAHEKIEAPARLATLQSAFQHSMNMSNTIELFLEGRGISSSVSVAQMNKVLSKQAEKLGAMMVEIRTAAGAH